MTTKDVTSLPGLGRRCYERRLQFKRCDPMTRYEPQHPDQIFLTPRLRGRRWRDSDLEALLNVYDDGSFTQVFEWSRSR